MKILVMGLSGAGKSTLAKKLALKIDAIWINADDVRKKANFFPSFLAGRALLGAGWAGLVGSS